MTAPDVFPLDDSGYSGLPPESEVESDLEKEAWMGARQCPERAITIVEQ
jgi:ferredoxin